MGTPRFHPRQPVQIESWGLKNCPLRIASVVRKPKHPGVWYKMRASHGILPGNYHEDLIRERERS